MKSETPLTAQTQRLASLGFMLARVCHEVSNPLAAVSSMLQILQSKRGITPETLEKGLASIAANVARVRDMHRPLQLTDLPARVLLQCMGRNGPDVDQVARDIAALTETGPKTRAP